MCAWHAPLRFVGCCWHLIRLCVGDTPSTFAPQPEPVEVKVDHGRRIEREHLAYDQAADDGNAERPADLAALAKTDGKRYGSEHRRHRGHHDWPKAQDAGLVDRLL